MSSGKNLPMDGLSPNIPIRYDYSEYTYDEESVADTARTEASSTRDYKYEHGRRYHAYREGSYAMPNDELNAEHENIAHHICGIMLQDKLYLPPIEEPKNVLDLGTGIGLWAFDMAERFPEARILGVDLTPPPESLIRNLEFQVDDFTEEWMPGQKYDFIHARLLYGAVRDWPALYSRIFENLEPGGYMQQIDMEIRPQCDDGTLPKDNIFEKLADVAKQLSGGTGGIFTVTGNMRPQMEAAGFVDIVEHRFKVPLGPWSSNPVYQNLGYFFELFWRSGCHGWMMGPATRALGWTPSQVNATVEEAFKQIDARTAHVYFEAVAIYGRKPE